MPRRGRGRSRRNREEIESRVGAVRRSSRSRPKRRGRKGPSPLARLVMVLLLLALLAGIVLLVASALRGGEEEPVAITVEEGDTLSNVADKLDEAGVIGSSTLFELQARVRGGATQLKPGEYRIVPGESGEEILATLSSEENDVSTFALTIPEGLTIEQTAQAVERDGGIPAAEFLEAAKRTDYGYAFLEDPAVKSTEGFLFPKSYEFERGTDAEGMVNRFLEQYLIETEGLDFRAAEQRFNLTEYQLVTVASLIEKESANPEERPKIASVIYNRIRAGMPLQIDATVQYALGEPKENLSLADLEVQSPYNTYENPGLPPGPIASPSRESIVAALDPDETDYLYYVLRADGREHFFTNDYDEFLAAKAEAGR